MFLLPHYMDEADALASKILVLNEGKIIFDGTPTEVKSQMGGPMKIRMESA